MPESHFCHKFSLILTAFLLLAFQDAHSQSCTDKVKADEIKATVEFLSDSICTGRATGTPGATEAACRIAGQFDMAGLEVLGGSRFQRFSAGDRIGCNVIGIRPGAIDRYILVGAHYDGLGIIGGRMLPGADSNASGVAALCAIAAALPRDLKVGLIFVAFDGYTSSFAGAKAFSEAHPELKISTMISLDILGGVSAPVHPGEPDYLIALGAQNYVGSLYWAAYGQDIHLYYDYYGSKDFTRLFYSKIGDQTVFARRGCATIVFTSGITMDTNKPSDLPKFIDFDILCRRTRLICRWLEIKTTGS